MANDKELEQQNRTLKELADSQKETNKTLTTGFAALQKAGAADSTFMSKNLGSLMEVAATRGAQKRQEAFDKREEITEVDEKVEKLTEENVKEGKKSRNLLRTIAEFSQGNYDKANIAASKATEMAREGANKLQKLGSTIVKGVSKVFKETWGSMTKVAKRLTFGGLLFAAFMVAFMNFLDSDLFEKGFKILKEQIIPSMEKIWNVIKVWGKWIWATFQPLIDDITNYMKEDGEGPRSEHKKKTPVRIFLDNWKVILGGIGGLALLLAPKAVFGAFWKSGKFVIGKTLGAAVKTLLKALITLPAILTGSVLQTAGMGTAGGMAAQRNVAGATVKSGAKIGGAKFVGGGEFGKGEWQGKGGQKLMASEQAKLTKQWQAKQAKSIWSKLGSKGLKMRAAAKAFAPLAIVMESIFAGAEAYNIFENMKPGPERNRALADLLFGSIGSIGFAILGAGVGGALGGPIGLIAGGIGGSMFGEKAGLMVANWLFGDPVMQGLLGGKDKPRKVAGEAEGGGIDYSQIPMVSSRGMGYSHAAGGAGDVGDPTTAYRATEGFFGQTMIEYGSDMVPHGKIALKRARAGKSIRKDDLKYYSDQPWYTPDMTAKLKADHVPSDVTPSYAYAILDVAKKTGQALMEMTRKINEMKYAQYGPTDAGAGMPHPLKVTSQPQPIIGALTWRDKIPPGVVIGRSDIRLKEDIELIGKSPLGINIYSFKYMGEEEKYQGVMAQEVLWASTPDEKGYYSVDYSKLDVDFLKLN